MPVVRAGRVERRPHDHALASAAQLRDELAHVLQRCHRHRHRAQVQHHSPDAGVFGDGIETPAQLDQVEPRAGDEPLPERAWRVG
jgi:hypothetical protein